MNPTTTTTTLQRFRWVAIAEGCSYLLFALTMPLKYVWGILQPNFVVGAAHGALFMLYVLLLLLVARQMRWSITHIALAFAASLIPFGTFFADKQWFGTWGT